MKGLTTLGEAQRHLVMPVKTGIQEGKDLCSLDPGLRQDDKIKQGAIIAKSSTQVAKDF
jgi:hypothetical protein